MARYTASIRSNRSVEDTFDYMADFTNAEAWDPGVISARRLDAGRVGVGSRFALEFRFGTTTVPLEYAVTDIQDGRSITLRAERPSFTVEDVISVHPADGGALVHYQASMTLHGPMRLLSPLFGWMFRRGASGAGHSLAAVLGA